MLLVGGAIARLLVLVLPHRLAGVLRQRTRVHQHGGYADGAVPVEIQVRRAPGLIWKVSWCRPVTQRLVHRRIVPPRDVGLFFVTGRYPALTLTLTLTLTLGIVRMRLVPWAGRGTSDPGY